MEEIPAFAFQLLAHGLCGMIREPVTSTGALLRRLARGALISAGIGFALSLPWDGSDRAWLVGSVAVLLLVSALGLGWGADVNAVRAEARIESARATALDDSDRDAA